MPIATGLGNSFLGLGHRSNHLCLGGSTALTRMRKWRRTLEQFDLQFKPGFTGPVLWPIIQTHCSLGNKIIWDNIQTVQQPPSFPFCPGVWQSEAAPQAVWNCGMFEENLRATSNCQSLQLTQREKCPQQVFYTRPNWLWLPTVSSWTPGWKKKPTLPVDFHLHFYATENLAALKLTIFNTRLLSKFSLVLPIRSQLSTLTYFTYFQTITNYCFC